MDSWTCHEKRRYLRTLHLTALQLLEELPRREIQDPRRMGEEERPVVIHQEKNTQTEHVAQAFAKELFQRRGYRIIKGKRGCDFIAGKGQERIPVAVKVRSTLI